MSLLGPRLKALLIKEVWAILRDPRARLVLIAPPLIQLFLFGFASTLEVNHFRVGVLNHDSGQWSREVVEKLAGSPNVEQIVVLRSDDELRRAINRQQVVVALRFPSTFSADVVSRRGAVVGAVYDGRRSNAAQIVSTYIARITGGVALMALRRPPPALGGADIVHLFNPNLDNLWFVMPALISILALISAMAIVSQSVARERELGTFDQLMVSPLRTHEMLIGKMLPPMAIGLANVTAFVIILPTIMGIPLTGSVPLLYFALFFYLLALTGIGMLISSISATQQQAFLGMFATIVPMVILSGYANPVDNMPRWLQLISKINPAAWFLNVSEGTFLKAMPASDVLDNTWPIAVIALVTTTAASALFRSRME